MGGFYVLLDRYMVMIMWKIRLTADVEAISSLDFEIEKWSRVSQKAGVVVDLALDRVRT
jgi:hypothetical protein